jgi:prepilin-type N-terminal cleavage/methylation domain-containing protein
MKIVFRQRPGRPRTARAFTIVEVSVSMAIIGIIVLAIYGALSSGISMIRMARENQRATQILLEKMEGVRLYTWEQLNTPGFIPSTFVVPYDARATDTNAGVLYYGSITITNSPNSTSYADAMRLVVVHLDWTTGNMPRTRSVQTYVSQAGIQNYIY